MSETHFDAIVVGGGAMGTAAAWQLAKRRKRVLLLEQFSIAHELGSSHGYSRIIRRAYFEHPSYVPLVERAYELWRELEAESGESLLTVTGIVEMGAPDGELVKGSLLSCTQHSIPHEQLNADEIRKRFPQFQIPNGIAGVWQKDAGILAVERCVLTMYLAAKRAGAIVLENSPVLGISPRTGGGAVVQTAHSEFTGSTVLVSAGAWAGKILADLKLPLTVARQAQGFYAPTNASAFEVGTFPVWLMEWGGKNFYGFPMFGMRAIKIAHHGGGATTTAETVDRIFRPDDDELLRGFMREHLCEANGDFVLGKICLYTNTPDKDFILDAHPSMPGVFIAAGFSGHGFKFATVVGEILAEFATNGKTRHPVGRFGIGRFEN